MAGYEPIATIAERGGVIADGTTIFVDADGTIHANADALHNLELTDGTHDVTAVGKITTTHMDVGGATPNATLKPSTATSSDLGIVTVDNTSIFVDSAGVLHAGSGHSALVSSAAGTGHAKTLDTGSDGVFDANDDYLTTGATIRSGTGDWSIAAWVKPAPLGASFGVIVSEIGNENAAGQHQFRLDGFTPQVIRRTGVGNAIVECTATAPLAAGVWAHVVAVCSGGTLSLYVNGAPAASSTTGSVYSAVAADTTNIGAMEGGAAGSPEYMFDGDMSDVRIYSTALSSTDVGNLYTPGLGAYPTVQAGSMLARWKFDEGTGGTAADSSGNGHTATWHGTGVHWGTITVAAPPANWYLRSFVEDGTWHATVLQTGPVPAPAPSPAQWIAQAAGDFENAGEWLLRYPFDLAAGEPIGPSLVLGIDMVCVQCFLNDTELPAAEAHDYSASQFPSLAIPAGLLVGGATNLLALHIRNNTAAPPNPSSAAFQVDATIVESTGLEIEHNAVPIGTRPTLNFVDGTGILISAADNPADNRVDVEISVTGSATIGVAENGTLEGTEPEINFIPGANVGLTVADNPAHSRVDVTIAANGAVGASGGQSGSVPITIAAGSATATAAVTFAPAFANPPIVIVSSGSGSLIASAESITRTGFVARLTANVNLAPGTSITATLYWSVGGLRPGGKFKPPLLRLFR